MSLDPYDVLGVPREASLEVLKAAYRRLVRDHHPDVASDKVAATARMASINQAWQTVGDPQKRAAFDARHRLDALEMQRRRVADSASREASESASSEAVRLEAQRLARLERDKIERERARRLRNVAKTTKSATKSSHTATKTATAPSTAHSGSKSVGASGAGTPTEGKSASIKSASTGAREARLRQKIVLAAQLFHRERKVEEAVSLCRSVLVADHRSVAARELLGDIYLQQGRAEYALMMFDQALLIEPNHLMLRRKRDQLQQAQERGRSQSPRIAPSPMPRSFLGRLRNRLSIKK